MWSRNAVLSAKRCIIDVIHHEKCCLRRMCFKQVAEYEASKSSLPCLNAALKACAKTFMPAMAQFIPLFPLRNVESDKFTGIKDMEK
jgi:hypothetical protein